MKVGDPAIDLIRERYQYEWHPDSLWIVTTHECCFASKNVESLEVMEARLTEVRPSSLLRTGHSARKIALPCQRNWLEVTSDSRTVLRRDLTERKNIHLEAFLDDPHLEVFKNWLGHRYSRPALPDKVSNFLSQRKIGENMVPLLNELDDPYRVLIAGHRGADQSPERVIGVSLVILLGPEVALPPEEDEKSQEWLERVKALAWADDDSGEEGVALDQIRFDSARDMSVAEMADYDLLDFDYISNARILDRDSEPNPG